ncbi:hypothetical protein GUJ93_ZPchr0013g36628 [Zizania palustris]|uniref:NAD-dependent epimerase/dehydratase domain-containing protein n=1 Tax=Zizania palustris TaxID=103762 RepID=A0A8J5X500_ZIZPA|nr:hypothetical protein GUJ93_ZPchr0013g36628 [Zizania palustris]
MAFSSTAHAVASTVADALASRRQSTVCRASSRLSSSFLSTSFPRVAAARAPAQRVAAVTVRAQAVAAGKKSVLIVNTNGGGHTVIGFYFSKELLAAGHAVTVLTVGEEGSEKMKKLPFSHFSELTSVGANTVWGDPADIDTTFDVVLDNNGKDLDTVKYVIIPSSPAFSSRLCRQPDRHAIVRKRPVPIPGSGMQVMNIAHVRDLAGMLALAVESLDAAAGKIFNCVSDRAITFNGLVKMCAAAAGVDAEIVHYDPAAVSVDAKKAFPFRKMVQPH